MTVSRSVLFVCRCRSFLPSFLPSLRGVVFVVSLVVCRSFVVVVVSPSLSSSLLLAVVVVVVGWCRLGVAGGDAVSRCVCAFFCLSSCLLLPQSMAPLSFVCRSVSPNSSCDRCYGSQCRRSRSSSCEHWEPSLSALETEGCVRSSPCTTHARGRGSCSTGE